MPPLPRPIECRGCPLDPISWSFSQPEGHCSNGVLIIGEALGENEGNDGLPFRPYAASGMMLEKVLRRNGMTRDSFGIWNCIACQPPKNALKGQAYEIPAINQCRVHMDRVMDRFKPKLIMALGNTALRTMAGMAGKKQGVGYVRGFVIPGTRYPLPVISSYHPAEIARGKTNLLSVQALDFHRAVYYAQHGFDWTKDRPRRRYILFPSPIEAEIWAREYLRQPSSTVLMYDIETEETSTTVDEVDIRVLADGRLQIMSYPDDTRETVEALERDEEAGEDVGPRVEIKAQCMITQIQFSWKSGEAIVLPWTSSYDRAIRMLLEDRGHLKAGWNSYHFDNPLLRAHGFELQGPLHDAMWLWHHLQPDLPRGLQFVCSCYMPWVEPWKHRTDNMGQYGGDDVSHLAEFFYPMYDALDQNGVRRAYDEHVVALWSELDAAAQLGIGVDEQARVEFVDELELARVELLLKIQELVPEQLRNIEPKLGYKKPKDAEKRRLVTKLDPGEKWVQQEIEGELRWARLQPFLPTSPQQLIRYIKFKTDQAIDERVGEYRSNARWAKLTEPELRLMAAKNVKWKVPKTRDGKDTTGKKELDRLRKATGDEFFKVNVEYREIVKAKGTYGEGWKPGKDGRVHTTFGYSPATGQLSSRGPNVQNCPK